MQSFCMFSYSEFYFKLQCRTIFFFFLPFSIMIPPFLFFPLLLFLPFLYFFLLSSFYDNVCCLLCFLLFSIYFFQLAFSSFFIFFLLLFGSFLLFTGWFFPLFLRVCLIRILFLSRLLLFFDFNARLFFVCFLVNPFQPFSYLFVLLLCDCFSFPLFLFLRFSFFFYLPAFVSF